MAHIDVRHPCRFTAPARAEPAFLSAVLPMGRTEGFLFDRCLTLICPRNTQGTQRSPAYFWRRSRDSNPGNR